MQYKLLNKIYERLSQLFSDTYFNRFYYYSYIALIFLIASYYFIQLPIMAGDTDLWYHLNSGRYTFEHGHPPSDSFFSFISPSREWVDYYWLFQVFVYSIYSFFDYYGLIILRTSIYIATGFLVLLFLLKRQEKNKYTYLLAILTVFIIVIQPRYNLVRPHIFSYLFIVLFIYILEFKPRPLIYLLPLFSTLWFNLHGIEYPVVFLIILSYLAEFFISHIKNREHIKKEELYFIIPIVISLCTIYLTPHVYKLIGIPFISTKHASIYIKEFQRIFLKDLITFEVVKLIPAYNTAFNILFIIIGAGVIKALWQKNIRLSHLFMFIGGTILLTKLGRFRYEFLLLSLPIIRNYPIDSVSVFLNKKRVVAICLLILFHVTYFHNSFSNPPKYPFSQKNLPDGVTAFLRHVKTGGNVLNHPNNGGYLQWMLYPEYKIFMDMEVPFLFTDGDFHTTVNLFSNESVFRKVIETYHPDFISVPAWHNDFKGTIKNISDYTIVFFDDNEVLYVDKKKHPDISERYEIKDIDPFTIIGTNIDTLLKEKGSEKLLQHLLKMYAVYPDSGVVNQLIAIIYNKTGKYQDAVIHAERVINSFPEASTGYRLKADALKALKKSKEAVIFYNKAAERASTQEAEKIYKDLGLAYIDLQDYKNAYKSFKKSINPYSLTATHIDLYYLGSSAFLAGNIDEAEKTLRYAYKKAPSDDTEWRESIKKHLELLGSIPKEL